MRKILALIIALCSADAAAARYEIREEYRRDVINYDEESRSFLRQGFTADTGAARAFLSHTYLPREEEHAFNWSLELRDLPRGNSLMAGHYTASFGSGLFLGSRRYSSPDPFASRPFPSSDSFISASRSTSPLYSFSGVAARHEILMDEARLETALFCSMRKRYIHFDDYDRGRVDSSMDSVNSRLERDGFYAEPVLLRDCGAAILLSYRQGLSAGVAAYGGDMRSCSGRELIWDGGKGKSSDSGIAEFSGSMLYMKYADDHLFSFCELGLARAGGNDDLTGGYGFSAGSRFRSRMSALRFLVTRTGAGFYAPGGADGPFPREECDFSASLRPHENIVAGISASYEHRSVPGKTDACLKTSRREGFFIDISGGGLQWKSAIDLLLRDEARGARTISREESSLKWNPEGDLSLMAKGSNQHEGAESLSWSVGGGLQYRIISRFFLGLDISFFSIGGSSVYSGALPAENALASGSFIDKTSLVAVMKAQIYSGNFRFSMRFQQSRTGDSFGRGSLDLMAGVRF
jgi:hypothetical protein